MRRSVQQFGRFAIVGTASFLIDYALLMVLSQLAGMNPVLAGGISYVVSVVFNYLVSMKFVFTRREDISRRRQFGLFVLLSAVALALNELIIWIGLLFVPNTMLNLSLVKLVATMMVTLWNFFSRGRWLDANTRAEYKSGKRGIRRLRIWWIKRRKRRRVRKARSSA